MRKDKNYQATNYQRIMTATRTMEKALGGYFTSDWIIKVENEIDELKQYLDYFNEKEEVAYYFLKDKLHQFKNRKKPRQAMIFKNYRKRYERKKD